MEFDLLKACEQLRAEFPEGAELSFRPVDMGYEIIIRVRKGQKRYGYGFVVSSDELSRCNIRLFDYQFAKALRSLREMV